MKQYIIRKNTFKIKEQLKQAGCKWNSVKKLWVFPNESATKGFSDVEYVEIATIECAMPKKRVPKINTSSSDDLSDFTQHSNNYYTGIQYVKLVIVKIEELTDKIIFVTCKHADKGDDIIYQFYLRNTMDYGEGLIMEVQGRIEYSKYNYRTFKMGHKVEINFDVD